MKSVPLVWHTLHWPRDVNAEDLGAVMRLLVTAAGSPMILEAIGNAAAVTHRIAVAEGRHENIAHQLRSAMPGVRVDTMTSRPQVNIDRAIELRMSTKHRPLRLRPDVGRDSLHPRRPLRPQGRRVLGPGMGPRPHSSPLLSPTRWTR